MDALKLWVSHMTDFVSITSIAKTIGIHPKTIKRNAEKAGLTVRKLGPHLTIIDRVALYAYLDTLPPAGATQPTDKNGRFAS
jgi:hypothetical protein